MDSTTILIASGVTSLFALVISILIVVKSKKNQSKSLKYPEAFIKGQAIKAAEPDDEDYPFLGLTAIVTGSTAGLGKEIAAELYNLGANVIIASRNEAKCKEIVSEIKLKIFPSRTRGSLEVGVLDVSDLDSVITFVNHFKKSHSSLHYLINNAGIHYIHKGFQAFFNHLPDITSKQGYDLSFATNYLGHFLLTKLLLPVIHDSAKVVSERLNYPYYGKVINISSSLHFESNGSNLIPKKNGGIPVAADPTAQSYHQKRLSYADTKLAQILHVKEEQKRLEKFKETYHVKIIASCPGWTTSEMVPQTGPIFRFIHSHSFPTRVGIVGTLGAIVDTTRLRGGEFVTNYVNYWAHTKILFPLLKWSGFVGLREVFADILAFWVLYFESESYGYHIEPSSAESTDAKLAETLYNWTEAELIKKGYLSSK